MPTWGIVLLAIGCFIVGIVIGYFVSRWLFKRELEKNPPISEAQIKAMYSSMGQTPSQANVNKTMRAMQQASAQGSSSKKKKKKKK